MYNKFRVLADAMEASVPLGVSEPTELSIPRALVEVAIAWRNNISHYFANNTVSAKAEKFLRSNASTIEQEYCGLSISMLFDVGDGLRRTPSFKEVASLMSATHKFVEQSDSWLLERLDLERYCLDVLSVQLESANLYKSFNNVWGKTEEKRLKTLQQILQNHAGVQMDEQYSAPTFLKELAALTQKEAVAFFASRRLALAN